MRVIITGSRHWDCHALAARVVSRLIEKHGDRLVVVHGACPTGVDAAFDRQVPPWVAMERWPANWGEHGKAAGPIRNQAMVDAGADLCLAFTPSFAESRGTRDCATRAMDAGIPTWLTRGEDDKPERLQLRSKGD